MKTRTALIVAVMAAFAFSAEAQADSFRHPSREEVTTGLTIYRVEGKDLRPLGHVTAVRDGMVFWRPPTNASFGQNEDVLTPIGDVLRNYFIREQADEKR